MEMNFWITMACKTNIPCLSFFFSIQKYIKHTSFYSSINIFDSLQGMYLPQIHIIGLQAFKRSVEVLPCSFSGTLARFSGQEELFPMVFQPGADAFLRLVVVRCGINVVDTMLQGQVKRSVCVLLNCFPECGSAEDKQETAAAEEPAGSKTGTDA